MECLYDGRVRLKVADAVRGTWALPTDDEVSVGRVSGAGIHIPNRWVPEHLCRFLPYEQGWLLQLGRARARVLNKYLDDITFNPRAVIALQPGRTKVWFPELDDLCRMDVVIGAGQDQGLPVAEDQEVVGEGSRTSYAAYRINLTDVQRQRLAVAFEHLLKDQRAPSNVAATAAAKLGTSEQVVKKVLAETKEKINLERWLNLETTEQLGHYLVHLSRNLVWDDLPAQFRDSEGLPG